MNAIELFHKDGRPAGVWYCVECKLTFSNREAAELCCKPYVCSLCGKPCKQFHSICESCLSARTIAVEQERFEKAVKLTEWDGCVYREGLGFQDGFFSSTDELAVYCLEDGVDIPHYAWTCKGSPFACATIDRIIDDIQDRAYEGFDMGRVTGLAELDVAIETFNLANDKLLSYEPDYARCVLLEGKP